MTVPNQQDTLTEIIAMMKRNSLTLKDIENALHATPAQITQQSNTILIRGFSYIGGILVFIGLIVLAGRMWDTIGSFGHIILTLGSGFAAFIMALVCTTNPRFDKASTPFFLIAAALQPLGILITMDTLSSGGDPVYALLFMNLLMIIQQGCTFWAKQRTVLALLTILFTICFFSIFFDHIGMAEKFIGLAIGSALMYVGWKLNASAYQTIAAINVCVGSTLLFISLFDIIKNTSIEILFLGVACACIFMSTVMRSRVLLITSTLAMLSYISYFSSKYFPHSVGWPLTLIIIGALMIGFGSVAINIHRKYISRTLD